MTKLSFDALNDILEASAYSGKRLQKSTVKELAKLSERELAEVEKLYDEHQAKADEEMPPLGFRG